MKQNDLFSLGAILFYLLVLLVCSSVAIALAQFRRSGPTSLKSDKLRRSSTLPLRMLMEECDFLLRAYRDLGFDDPQNTRYPLNPASWPNFDPPTVWTRTQVLLCSLSSRTDWLVTISRKVFEEMSWKEYVEIFQIERQRTTIVNLEAALNAFKDLLKAKVTSV